MDIIKQKACNLLIIYFCLVATCIISPKQTETDVFVEVLYLTVVPSRFVTQLNLIISDIDFTILELGKELNS